MHSALTTPIIIEMQKATAGQAHAMALADLDGEYASIGTTAALPEPA